jgi:hypothetical protein
LNAKSEEKNTFYFDLKLNPDDVWGLHCVLSQEELFKNAEDWLPGGSLKLVVKVKF